MGNKTKELSSKQLKAIELLAIGQQSLTDITKEVGITRDTLWKWRKKATFRKAVADRTRELLADALPDIFNVMIERAREGDPRHIKLILEHLEKNTEEEDKGTDLSFTWKGIS